MNSESRVYQIRKSRLLTMSWQEGQLKPAVSSQNAPAVDNEMARRPAVDNEMARRPAVTGRSRQEECR